MSIHAPFDSVHCVKERAAFSILHQVAFSQSAIFPNLVLRAGESLLQGKNLQLC